MKPITEEMGVHKKWYEARPQTPDDLAAFVKMLLTEYSHDYGTICHAVAAAALAAARTVDADPEHGGVTGFQASCIMWEFVRHWMHYDSPMRLLQIQEMLYPQYEDRFRTISEDAWKWLQREAKNGLAAAAGASDRVAEHWRSIVDGVVPFGYRVEK